MPYARAYWFAFTAQFSDLFIFFVTLGSRTHICNVFFFSLRISKSYDTFAVVLHALLQSWVWDAPLQTSALSVTDRALSWADNCLTLMWRNTREWLRVHVLFLFRPPTMVKRCTSPGPSTWRQLHRSKAPRTWIILWGDRAVGSGDLQRDAGWEIDVLVI